MATTICNVPGFDTMSGTRTFRPDDRTQRHRIYLATGAIYEKFQQVLKTAHYNGLSMPLLEAALLDLSRSGGDDSRLLLEAWQNAHATPEQASLPNIALIGELYREFASIWQLPQYRHASARAIIDAQRLGHHGSDLIVEVTYRDTSPL